VEKHRYGDGPSQYGELLVPEGEPPARGWPVAVVLHGGFWKAAYGRKLMWPVCGDLMRRGWAAWNLEYRRLGLNCGGGWPATFDDVRAGLAHLERLDAPLDLDRVVALGHSAGGHLALWAAAQDGAVRAAVSQAGVADLTYAHELRLSSGVVRRLLGGDPDEVPDRYAAASPAALVPVGVPMLCVHGARDDTVPPSVSERFTEKARLAGDRCELELFEDGDHMGHIDPEDPMWRAAVDWLEPWQTA
jgi:dipeptidyl aminopeptidase/acylaminoacyl peptidase